MLLLDDNASFHGRVAAESFPINEVNHLHLLPGSSLMLPRRRNPPHLDAELWVLRLVQVFLRANIMVVHLGLIVGPLLLGLSIEWLLFLYHIAAAHAFHQFFLGLLLQIFCLSGLLPLFLL